MQKKLISEIFKITVFPILLLQTICSLAQDDIYAYQEKDKNALEGVIVEKFYKVQGKDLKDKVGGRLPKNAIVYRIYVDLKPGYKLQSVWGSDKHLLCFQSTKPFYNDTVNGVIFGSDLDTNYLKQSNSLFDSWISMGAVTRYYNGILKTEDSGRSILASRKGFENADGMIYSDIFRTIYVNMDLKVLEKSTNLNKLTANDGAWANYASAKGPTDANKILIAQLTTSGRLSYSFNIQVLTPEGNAIQFVAENPQGKEVLGKQLILK